MALDFCIRNNHDEIMILAHIGVDSFYNIIEFSKNSPEFSIIPQKLKDYYDDTEFYISELPVFKSELENFQRNFINNTSTLETIYVLIKLCDIALYLNKTISVIAD